MVALHRSPPKAQPLVQPLELLESLMQSYAMREHPKDHKIQILVSLENNAD